MVTHAILAAGRGTRLFGDRGGNKPMAPVAGGHLIDYVVREAERLPILETRLLVSQTDTATVDRVRSLTSSRVVVVPSPSDGTGPGVRRVLEGTDALVIVLSTCDLAAPTGALGDFYAAACQHVATSEPRCVIATSPRDPEDLVPIYVDVVEGVVVAYGKEIEPVGRTFAGARVMNAAFRALLLSADAGIATDTQMMAAAVRSVPGSVVQLDVIGLFDVDDAGALRRAELITKAGRDD